MTSPRSAEQQLVERRERFRHRITQLVGSWTTSDSPARVLAAAYRSALEVVAKEEGYASIESVRQAVGKMVWHGQRS